MTECRVSHSGFTGTVTVHEYNAVLRDVVRSLLERRLARIGRGEVKPSPDHLYRLAGILVSYALLYGGVCGYLGSGLRDLERDEAIEARLGDVLALLLGVAIGSRGDEEAIHRALERLFSGAPPKTVIEALGRSGADIARRLVEAASELTGVRLTPEEVAAALEAWLAAPRAVDILYVDARTRELAAAIRRGLAGRLESLAARTAQKITELTLLRKVAADHTRPLEERLTAAQEAAKLARITQDMLDELATKIAALLRTWSLPRLSQATEAETRRALKAA